MLRNINQFSKQSICSHKRFCYASQDNSIMGWYWRWHHSVIRFIIVVVVKDLKGAHILNKNWCLTFSIFLKSAYSSSELFCCNIVLWHAGPDLTMKLEENLIWPLRKLEESLTICVVLLIKCSFVKSNSERFNCNWIQGMVEEGWQRKKRSGEKMHKLCSTPAGAGLKPGTYCM